MPVFESWSVLMSRKSSFAHWGQSWQRLRRMECPVRWLVFNPPLLSLHAPESQICSQLRRCLVDSGHQTSLVSKICVFLWLSGKNPDLSSRKRTRSHRICLPTCRQSDCSDPSLIWASRELWWRTCRRYAHVWFWNRSVWFNEIGDLSQINPHRTVFWDFWLRLRAPQLAGYSLCNLHLFRSF